MGLVWFKLRYLMWYFKNKTQLQQLVFCEYCFFFLFFFTIYYFFLFFLGTNIRMEQKYPKLLYCIEIQPLQFYHDFDAPFPTFFVVFSFQMKEMPLYCEYLRIFFSFGKNYKTFKNLKQIKYKKSVCGLFMYSNQSFLFCPWKKGKVLEQSLLDHHWYRSP